MNGKIATVKKVTMRKTFYKYGLVYVVPTLTIFKKKSKIQLVRNIGTYCCYTYRSYKSIVKLT
jgi:hypothetical protein